MVNIQKARIDAHVSSLDELGTDLQNILASHATSDEVNTIRTQVDDIV